MNTSLINHAPEIKVSDRTLTVGNALLLPIQYNIIEIENRYIVSMKGAMTYGKISKSLCAN